VATVPLADNAWDDLPGRGRREAGEESLLEVLAPLPQDNLVDANVCRLFNR